MNKYNHFLTGFNVLFLIFMRSVSVIEIILFSYVFGVLIDKTQKLGPNFEKKPTYHKRMWIEEPFGLILVCVPLGAILSLIKPQYFLMAVIPYAIHILLDYMVVHEVCPLAPFSNKNVWLKGIFKAEPSKKWHKWTKGKPSENYLIVANVIFLTLLMGFYFFGGAT